MYNRYCKEDTKQQSIKQESEETTMVRISAETQYNLMRAVERYSNYYKNTTHTYFFKGIYRDTDNTFVYHVTRISNKDLGRLVEPETVGYIKLYLDNKTKKTEFFR